MSSSIKIYRTLRKECNNIFLCVKQAPFKNVSASNLSHKNSFLQTQHLSTVVEDKSRFSEDDNGVPEADRYIHKSEVERFMIDSMVKVGTERNRAEMLAANLSEADYRGHFSHGLNRLAMYVDDLQNGLCDPHADPKILKESQSTAWIDGCNTLGVVVGEFA